MPRKAVNTPSLIAGKSTAMFSLPRNVHHLPVCIAGPDIPQGEIYSSSSHSKSLFASIVLICFDNSSVLKPEKIRNTNMIITIIEAAQIAIILWSRLEKNNALARDKNEAGFAASRLSKATIFSVFRI
jgi:hypothetical protein